MVGGGGIAGDRVLLPFARPAEADEVRLQLVYQPILDLETGAVAGYEALSRFPSSPGVGPDVWFAEAARRGVGAQLEARAIGRALDARDDLPRNCFLTVNVSPHLVTEPALQQVFAGHDLRGLVVELTEHVPVVDGDRLTTGLDVLRRAGAKIALDDAGSGYAGLQQMLESRPDIIKLDRVLVAGLDRDVARQAAVEALGALADRLDAVVLAEGIETVGELRALQDLGVPLGQGYLLGRPHRGWTKPTDPLVAALRRAEPPAVPTVAELLDVAPHRCPALDRAPQLLPSTYLVDVDGQHRPLALWAAGPHAAQPVARPLVLAPTTPAVDALRRMLTRPAAERHLPALCTDDAGRYLGLVHHDRLTLRLIESLTRKELSP